MSIILVLSHALFKDHTRKWLNNSNDITNNENELHYA